MKKLIITIVLSLLYVNIIQAQRTCGSELNISEIEKTNPKKYNMIVRYESKINKIMKRAQQERSSSNSRIIIPVVVHVVYNNSSQNINDTQVLSQIQVLNEDFNRINRDRVNTPDIFKNIAGNSSIEFKLAKIDPNGNSTVGITRTYTKNYYFSASDNSVKFSSKGGCNAWNTEKYLNIWVCNLEDNLLGYAQFPFDFGNNPNTDGVVISYKYFGRDGSAEYPFNKGRTTTHEVGHWLNLRHIWGDAKGCDNGTDYCDDTPTHYYKNYKCYQEYESCSSTGDMYMNFMDYTDDDCMNLFTKDQISRMRTLFEPGEVRESIKKFGEEMFPIVILGSDIICNKEAYTIENLPIGAEVKWSIDSSHNDVKISSSGVVAKLMRETEGEATITANITTPSGDTFSISKTVQYISEYIEGYFGTNVYSHNFSSKNKTHYTETSINVSGRQRISIRLTKPSKLPSSCELDWELLGRPRCVEGVYRNSYNNLTIDISEPFMTDIIKIKISLDCCSKASTILTIRLIKSRFYTYNISDGILTIKNDESNSFQDVRSIEQDEVKREIKKVEIYNLQGNRVVNFTPSIFRKVFEVEIPIGHLPSGFYALRVYDGKQWHKKKVWLK